MKKDYMARLERAARWRLPPQEAEDVIADYRDIVSQPPRTEEQLRREIGDPEQVVRLLVSPSKAYCVWLAVFAALALCLLSAALAPMPASPFFMLSRWYEWGSGYKWGDPEFTILTLLPTLQLAVGIILCLVWFLRRREKAKRPLPKGMILCALLMLAGIALAWWAVWRLSSDPERFLTVWTIDESITGEGRGPAYRGKMSPDVIIMDCWLEYGGCALAGLIGFIALVKARTRDRRWAAVYLLALTAAVLSLAVLAMMWNFVSAGGPREIVPDGWFQPYLPQLVLLTALGLVGMGISLC